MLFDRWKSLNSAKNERITRLFMFIWQSTCYQPPFDIHKSTYCFLIPLSIKKESVILQKVFDLLVVDQSESRENGSITFSDDVLTLFCKVRYFVKMLNSNV